MSPVHQTPTQAADALIGVTPLIGRWIERLLANHDPRLTVTQFLTLRAVAGGIDSSTALARSAAVSGPAVSQLVSGLVDAGLLTRGDAAGDRRRARLALSTKGTETLESANAVLRDAVAGALGELPHPEVDALAQALPYVEAVLAGVTPPRRPVAPRPPAAPIPPRRRL